MWTELNETTSEEEQIIEQQAPVSEPPAPFHGVSSLPKMTGEVPVRTRMVLWGITLMALWYVFTTVSKYLTVTRETYGIFWPRHQWLFAHAIAGTFALVVGPIQFYLGLKREQPSLHRVLGMTYVACTFIGGISALYLAAHTVYGWMYGAGLTLMAVVWMATTSIAVAAIWQGLAGLHRQWIIRSYVLTFGFVMLRLTTDILEMANIGTLSERLTFSAWVSWSVPLLFVECVLQVKRLFAPKSAVQPVSD